MYPHVHQWQKTSQHHWPSYEYNDNQRTFQQYGSLPLHDYGTRPLVVNINLAAKQNNNYRTALWTGQYFQITLMNINVGEDIGLEMHPTTDQFIRIEQGQGLVQMGDSNDHLDFQAMAYDDYAIVVPAGKWHNVTNIGKVPLKLYVIYAPPHHPFGTVQETRPFT
ncbi:cupin domain-containing protein [Paenibacillus sp. UNC496MF]|uniref:cupin domain-containing protein n=1 Tax=Paenibacillus sp. UNC496MF TaxID=1502753 RepID=UPI000A919671|nr:cupin domain-containing protein [Paenibacillus sp. UNC496MF]